jgi:hypothetical protein
MSVVTVQLGQCGNQVGGALFSVFAAETLSAKGKEADDAEAFFRRRSRGTPWAARAVLVDMEPKVRFCSILLECIFIAQQCLTIHSSRTIGEKRGEEVNIHCIA